VLTLKLIAYSTADPAGDNIAVHLRSLLPFSPCNFGSTSAMSCGDYCLVGLPCPLISLEMDAGGIEWLLCLSRHKSESGRTCLTAHTPGNPAGKADYGGEPGSVGISNARLQSVLIRELVKSRDALGLSIDVSVEATHHGPTELAFPVTFVEIGSERQSWEDPGLGGAVARAVAASIRCLSDAPPGAAMAVGGGHYPEKFTALMASGEYSIGHIIPKYAMTANPDPAIFRRCMERTQGGCSCIIVDWKGTPSTAKDALRSISQSSGIELVRV
jgi:D-aminoacyl-tRNA deacylase